MPSGEVVRGLIRVQDAAVGPILAASGAKAGAARWFVETAKPPDPRYAVDWIDPLENESPAAYGARAFKLNRNLGLTLGLRQIGVRRPHTKEDEAKRLQRVRSGEVHGVPFGWDIQEIQDLLTDGGFAAVEITAKFRRQGKLAFAFKATRADLRDNIDIECDGVLFTVVDAVRRRARRAPEIHELNTERTAFFDGRATTMPGKDGAKAAAPASKLPPKGAAALPAAGRPPAAPAPAPPAADAQDADMVDEEPPSKQAKKDGDAFVPPAGFTVIPNRGEGDCLYLAFSDALRRLERRTRSVTALRALAVAHMGRHAHYADYWDARLPDGSEAPAGSDFSVYLKAFIVIP